MRLTGHIRDAPDPRDLAFTAGGLPFIGSTEIDLREYCSPIKDQLAADCCAHATAEAAFAGAAADHRPIEFPSVLFLYANARLLVSDPGVPLVDAGTQLRAMFKSLSGHTVRDSRGVENGLGLVRDKDYPEVADAINVVPPDDLYRDGENAVIKSYSRIPDGSIDGLIAALQRSKFPTLAFVADDAFANIGGGIYHDAGGAVMGGHAMLVVGYSEEAHAFRVRNSWGASWGEDGYGWMDQGFVANHTFDHWVIEVTPEVLL